MIDTKENLLRTVHLRPYRKGVGPTFTLRTWYTGKTDGFGGGFSKPRIAYRFTMRENGKRTILFEGDDFFCGAGMAVDSNDAVAGLLRFLTLRPGDTDREYFDKYTPTQLEYANQHAETLSCECYARFGDH